MPKKFAVFDIDGTVIRWQLFHSVVNELAKRGHLSPEAARTIHEARMTWKRRTHSESYKAYERTLLGAYLAAFTDVSVADYLAVVDKVFDEYKDQVYTYTRDLIRALKEQGYVLLALSGSHQEIVEKLADYYGFDDAIGTVYEQKGGRFTGNVQEILHDKGEALQRLVAKHDLDFTGSIAVGDSRGDIPMLELVERPIAFNPAADLFVEATKRHWQIVVERKNVIYNLEVRDGSYVLAETDD